MLRHSSKVFGSNNEEGYIAYQFLMNVDHSSRSKIILTNRVIKQC